MKPIPFPQQNMEYNKPTLMTDAQCNTLPAFKGEDSEGFPVVISCWELSEEDITQLVKTKTVYLTVVSRGMPPISLQVETPFEND